MMTEDDLDRIIAEWEAKIEQVKELRRERDRLRELIAFNNGFLGCEPADDVVH